MRRGALYADTPLPKFAGQVLRRGDAALPGKHHRAAEGALSGSPIRVRQCRGPAGLVAALLLVAVACNLMWLVPATFAKAAGRPAFQIGRPVLLDTAAEEAARSRRPLLWQSATTLVIVAGHAIYTGSRWEAADLRNERNWFLEQYQAGMVDTFLAHIRVGVELVANDSTALLMFSGGITRAGVGPRSEGSSYWLAADALDWFGERRSVLNRTQVEGFARDSLENLLFSVCRFRQVTGRYPHDVKVVSFNFKRQRFTTVHRRALRFPSRRFTFVGVDPPGAEGRNAKLYAMERARTLGPFGADPYACNDSSLHGKRLDRNPQLLYHPYPQGCPEIRALFRYCGSGVYPGPLPWDPRVDAAEGAALTVADEQVTSSTRR
jgi:hypothetical protein